MMVGWPWILPGFLSPCLKLAKHPKVKSVRREMSTCPVNGGSRRQTIGRYGWWRRWKRQLGYSQRSGFKGQRVTNTNPNSNESWIVHGAGRSCCLSYAWNRHIFCFILFYWCFTPYLCFTSQLMNVRFFFWINFECYIIHHIESVGATGEGSDNWPWTSTVRMSVSSNRLETFMNPKVSDWVWIHGLCVQ